MPEPVLVSRARLFPGLSSTASLVVVQGNRFMGKTTLLRTWLSTDPVPGSAVIVVDSSTSRVLPRHYWGEVLTATCSVLCLEPPQERIDDFDAVCAAVTAVDRPIVLVLDGVTAIEARVGELLARCPGLRIVVTTRTRGSWPELVDECPGRILLTSDVLAFTAEETRASLQGSAAGEDLRVVHWIMRRTGAFPLLIDAVCSTLPAASDSPAADTDQLDRDIDSAVDRVLLQILDDDPVLAPVRRTVLLSSVASPLTTSTAAAIPQCADGTAVIGTLDAAGMIDRVSDPNGDDSPGSVRWRYPEVVRAALRRLAENACPGALHATETALVRYWLDRADPHLALTHAIEGRRWQVALAIVDEHWITLYTGGFLQTLGDALIEHIPTEIAATHPTVAAIRRLHRQFAAPRDVPVATVEPRSSDTPTDPAETIMHTMALRVDGNLAEAAAVCDAVSNEPVPVFDELGDPIRSAYAFYYLHIGITYLLVDRTDEAAVMFRRAHHAGAGMFVERDAAGKLALIDAFHGACTDADLWIEREKRHRPLPDVSEKLVRTAGCVATALVALDRLDPDTALDVLTDLGSPADNEEFWAFVLYTHGQHALLTGMPADGLRHIEAQIRRYPKLFSGIAATLVNVVRADLYLACGDLERARYVIGEADHPLTAPVRARMRLLTADPTGAEHIVERYRTDRRCSVRTSMELAVIGAAAASARGDRARAGRHLDRAVALFRHSGLARPFLLLPAPMVQDLVSLESKYPTIVADRAFEFEVYPSYRPIVRLSPRERVVLEALLAGGTAGTIAKEQFVSVNTVKTQLRSLYRKLGVRSRDDAIAAARKLILD